LNQCKFNTDFIEQDEKVFIMLASGEHYHTSLNKFDEFSNKPTQVHPKNYYFQIPKIIFAYSKKKKNHSLIDATFITLLLYV
jgi:hypothetical protein